MSFWGTRQGVALTAMVAVALPLTACSGGTGTANDELVIQSVWTKGSNEGDVIEQAITTFEETSGATVRFVDTGESTPDVYENDVLAGKEADIVLSNLAEKTNDWVTNGAVVPMDDYLQSWGLADSIRPEAVEQWRDDEGALIGLPYSGFTWPVWYNTGLLEQAGVDQPPTTVQELKDAAARLRDAGLEPMAIGGSDWSGQKLFLQIAQTYADPEATKDVYANGGFCENTDIFAGVELFTELRDAGVFIDNAQGYNADAMNSEFFMGKAAMMPAGSWAFGNTPEDVAAVTYLGGFPLPDGAVFDAPTAYQGYTGIGIMMSENGKAKSELVKQFVEILYSSDIVSAFVTQASLIPAATTAQDAEITAPMLSQAVTELDGRVEYAVMPDTVVPGSVSDPMISATALAFTPGNDAATVCAAIDAAYGQ